MDLFNKNDPIWMDWLSLYSQREDALVSKQLNKAVERYLKESAEKEQEDEHLDDLTDLDKFYLTVNQARALLDSKQEYGLFLVEVAAAQLNALKLTRAVWEKAVKQMSLLRLLADLFNESS